MSQSYPQSKTASDQSNTPSVPAFPLNEMPKDCWANEHIAPPFIQRHTCTTCDNYKLTSFETAVIRAASSLGMTTLASTRIIPDAIAGAQVARTGKAVNTLSVLETGFGSALQELVPTGGMGCHMKTQRGGLTMMSFVPGCWREYRPFLDLSGDYVGR
jgi:hypothetical protein